MSEKKQTTFKQKPEHTIRCGVVIISIHLRQSNCGFGYWDYTIQRTWQSVTTRKEARGSTFFDKNEADIVEAVGKASAWIREKVAQASVGEPSARENQDAS